MRSLVYDARKIDHVVLYNGNFTDSKPETILHVIFSVWWTKLSMCSTVRYILPSYRRLSYWKSCDEAVKPPEALLSERGRAMLRVCP